MTARSHQAKLERHRAELRQEALQQRQQAAVDAAREADDLRAAEAARVLELKTLRLARDARRMAAKAGSETV